MTVKNELGDVQSRDETCKIFCSCSKLENNKARDLHFFGLTRWMCNVVVSSIHEPSQEKKKKKKPTTDKGKKKKRNRQEHRQDLDAVLIDTMKIWAC